MKFTVPRKDLRRETFRGSGPGGQNRNKRETGVRLTHIPSGATGESCDERSQAQNQAHALRRLVTSPRFRSWASSTLDAMAQGYESIDARVDASMAPENLLIEYGEKE